VIILLAFNGLFDFLLFVLAFNGSLRYSNPEATLRKRAPKPLRHEERAQSTRK
jgi:hypothetical protein